MNTPISLVTISSVSSCIWVRTALLSLPLNNVNAGDLSRVPNRYGVRVRHIYILFAVREVRIGKNCARGLEYSRPRAQFFPIWTDQGRQITCVYFFFFGTALKATFVFLKVLFSLRTFSSSG